MVCDRTFSGGSNPKEILCFAGERDARVVQAGLRLSEKCQSIVADQVWRQSTPPHDKEQLKD
jgi:hypothetical protein